MEDLKQQIQEAGGFLRTAERQMFSGKNQEAVELLNKADDIALQAAKTQPDDFQVKSLLQKIEKMRKDLERKGIVTRPGGKEELPFEVNAQLQRVKESVLNGNLERAQEEMKNYYSRFAGPYTDLPEIKELSTLIEKMEHEDAEKKRKENALKQAKASENAAHEELCASWREKLKTVPYFDGTPHNVFDLMAHVDACKKAVQVINEYMTVTFSQDPDYTLQSMVEDIKRRVELFIPNYHATLNDMSSEIIQRINTFTEQLNNDKAWQTDNTKLAIFVSQSQMNEFLNQIEEMRPVCVENMQVFNDMMATYQTLHDLNEERKKARAGSVRMKPEAMNGPDAEKLIQKATETLLIKYPGAEILKIAVVREWEYKFEEGWEDNTKSKWVKRNFRETTIQAAATLSAGDHRLFNIYIEETKISESDYAGIKCHIMYDELICPENFI